MTDLSRLAVSLTKHNAHKIALLLKKYKTSEILNRLGEVHAETAQAHKNLSVQPGNVVPQVWDKAKQLGDGAVDALVLVGIIFSHHQLIDAMASASEKAEFSGRIERGIQLKDKAYTNYVRIVDQLEFASKLDYSGVTIDLKPMFEIPGFGLLVKELLELKLKAAKWNQANSLAEEAVRLKFHDVFSISAEELKTWLTVGVAPTIESTALLPKDEDFFKVENEGPAPTGFLFKPGHTERAVEPISKSASARTKANQLHNDIQNRLYAHLCETLGAKNVGTEVSTGSGTAIDVVTNIKDDVTFYEIKTSTSVRASIRQAIPQLLEYAFWPQQKRADRLVIVSQLPLTNAASQYIEYLRKTFNLPIFYQQFSLKTGKLV